MDGTSLKFIGVGLMASGMSGAAIGVGIQLLISYKEWHSLELDLRKLWAYSRS